MSFNWKQLKKPFIGLSPMADYTDSPFSLVCKKFGADVIYREMVSAEAVVRGNEKTLKMAAFDKKERPIILQIFGQNPKTMAEAARVLEEKYGPDGIDINMGCPARKIISEFNGASLMKEPKLAAKIVEAVKSAVACQVSVKTRTGWSDEKEILKFAPILEAAGADAIAIHGRTKAMGYGGRANWEIIHNVKNTLTIPIILNGDIVDFLSFKKAIEITGADGVLIGRGALGFPWIFQNIKKKKDARPSLAEIKKIILGHARLHLAHYGERALLRQGYEGQGIITFRKHLVFYFKGAPGAKKIREKMVQVESLKDLVEALKEI